MWGPSPAKPCVNMACTGASPDEAPPPRCYRPLATGGLFLMNEAPLEGRVFMSEVPLYRGGGSLARALGVAPDRLFVVAH